MGKSGEYTIEFVKLKNGKHEFEYKLGREFFEQIEGSLIKDGNIDCRLTFEKETTLFNLHFSLSGAVNLTCDTCLSEIDYPVKGNFFLVVKLVEEVTEESDDDILYLQINESSFDVASYIYDTITVSLPIRRTCGDEGNTKDCDNEMIRKLEAIRYKAEEDSKENSEGGDPRWDALKGIFNN